MTSNEAVLGVIDALDSLGVPYMLVGAYSVNVFGVPRATQDADFVVELGPASVSQLASRLGGSFRLDPQMSFETVTGTYRYVFEPSETAFRIELFLLSEDAHDQKRFKRRKPAEALGRTIWMPTAEDVIITKLRWSRHGKRAKDLDDARNVIAVQAGYLDWDYIQRWCDEHGTRALLDGIRASLPPLN